MIPNSVPVGLRRVIVSPHVETKIAIVPGLINNRLAMTLGSRSTIKLEGQGSPMLGCPRLRLRLLTFEPLAQKWLQILKCMFPSPQRQTLAIYLLRFGVRPSQSPLYLLYQRLPLIRLKQNYRLLRNHLLCHLCLNHVTQKNHNTYQFLMAVFLTFEVSLSFLPLKNAFRHHKRDHLSAHASLWFPFRPWPLSTLESLRDLRHSIMILISHSIMILITLLQQITVVICLHDLHRVYLHLLWICFYLAAAKYLYDRRRY